MGAGNNIIVTGGAGYIGSHACKALARAGYTPVTVDNLSTGWRDAVKFGPLEDVDLQDRAGLDVVFEKYQPVAVMHFAALSQVGESAREPGRYWRNNVLGSLNLIEACVKAGCLDFVFSSTCATYGEHDGILLTENTPQRPTNPYGKSKLAVEHMLQDFEISHGLRHVAFRYFNVAGADPEGEIGERHEPETHLIPLAIRAALGTGTALTVFGDDYPTPDGTCVRDYVHVCDLVDAHILGLKWLQDLRGSQVFNLGSGHGYSVREVLEAIAQVSGCNVDARIGARRRGDCAALVSGSTRALTALKWTPKYLNLLDVVSHAYAWEQNSSFVTKLRKFG